jgi:hypothetical protein
MDASPAIPIKAARTQYSEPAQGSPVPVPGTGVGVVVVVVDPPALVVVVVDPPPLVVLVVDPPPLVVLVVDPPPLVVLVVDPPTVVVVVPVVLQLGKLMVLSSRVTAPVRASTLPVTVLPVSTVADANARMLPTKVVLVPKVAELPTCQKTLHAWAPPMSFTVLPDAVMRVDPAWKTKTALESPWASRVTVPVNPRPVALLYTPGSRVWPPRSPDTLTTGFRVAASL